MHVVRLYRPDGSNVDLCRRRLVENGTAVIEAVVRARPATAKGRFVEGVTLSATMTPGVRVDPSPYITV